MSLGNPCNASKNPPVKK